MAELTLINLGALFGNSVDKEGWEYNKAFYGSGDGLDFEFYININRKDKIAIISEKEKEIPTSLLDGVVKGIRKTFSDFRIFYLGWKKKYQIKGKKLEMTKKCPKCGEKHWYFERQCFHRACLENLDFSDIPVIE